MTLASIVATFAYAASRPDGWYVREWPEAQSDRIAAAAGRTRSVFADDRYADWLLWTEPQLRGRVAYDVRFELFSPKQLELLVGYRNRTGATWRAAASRYALDVFDPTLQPDLEKRLRATTHLAAVVRAPRLVVLARPIR